jgi:hypothetical protein
VGNKISKSAAEMAVPVAHRLHPAQPLIAADVAGVGLAPIADQHDVAVVSVVAVVAHPVQVLLLLALVLELLRLHLELLPLEPVAVHLCPAVRTAVGVAQPPQQAVLAEVVLALQPAPVSDLIQTNGALILLQFPQFLQPFSLGILATAFHALLP